MTDDAAAIVLPDDPSLGTEVQVDYPGYRSTRFRAPTHPLVTLPEEFHSLIGPVFGESSVEEGDADLTRQHGGEALGERINVSGRVLDTDGRPIPRDESPIQRAIRGEVVAGMEARIDHADGTTGWAYVSAAPVLRDDVLSALINLGYHRPLAEKAVAAALKNAPYGTFEQTLKQALRAPLLEIALWFVRLDHAASRIVNADHSVM